MRIRFMMLPPVRRALADLGRTEDIKFSPSGKYIAMAGFLKNRLLIVRIIVDISSSRKKIELTHFVEIKSPHLQKPHGLDFLDEQTLMVANREGGVCVFRLPPLDAENKVIELAASQIMDSHSSHYLSAPSCITTYRVDANLYSALICNNAWHCVSQCFLTREDDFVIKDGGILLACDLSTPDGIALSSDRNWIAVSNHDTQSVLVFKNMPCLNSQSKAVGILRNVSYPHGVRFTSDDRFIFVADAGAPYIHIYAKESESWQGTHDPVVSLKVLNKKTFERGRYNPQEGGPKGIDIHPTSNLLVMTCEHQVLAFFDLSSIAKKLQRVSRVGAVVMNWLHSRIKKVNIFS